MVFVVIMRKGRLLSPPARAFVDLVKPDLFTPRDGYRVSAALLRRVNGEEAVDAHVVVVLRRGLERRRFEGEGRFDVGRRLDGLNLVRGRRRGGRERGREQEQREGGSDGKISFHA